MVGGHGGSRSGEGAVVLLLPRAVHVYVATAPCNLRKSFEGLTNEVRQVLAKDPLSGHVFVFLNRRREQASFSIPIASTDCALPLASVASAGVAVHADDHRSR